MGKFQMNVRMAKVDKEELLHVDNPNYQQLIKTYRHLEGINMDDCGHKPVHLILGACDFMCIKTNEPPPHWQDGRTCRGENKVWIDHCGSRKGDRLYRFNVDTNKSIRL